MNHSDWLDKPDEEAVVDILAAAKALAEPMALTAEMRRYINPVFPEGMYRAVVLTDLFASEPGQGVGGSWVEAIGRLCDQADITLYTDPACERSKAFYLSHGFEQTRNMHHRLVRWPPPSPALLAAMARDERSAL